ncbi:MAG: formyltransferase family protein, partial [Candidatus Omnitrophota bacterium]
MADGKDISGLKIFIAGNRGYASKILGRLLSSGENVAGICSRKEPNAFVGTAKRRVKQALWKTGLYSVDSFEYRNPFERFSSPSAIARRCRIAFFDADQIRMPSFEAKLRSLAPDIMFVAGFHRLIPESIIRIPAKGAVNFHPSLLPKHRGGTPNRWIIRNGEKETGV